MPPYDRSPNKDFVSERYDFDFDNIFDSHEDSHYQDDNLDEASLTQMAFWYMILLVTMLLTWLIVFFCLRIISLRQKTRNPQDRRMYVGSRARPSFSQQEPTIYVSPANLPPPPKYECMAPPSYEEVVGVHYPQYSPQPITQPIASAMAQQSTDDRNVATSSTNQNATSDSTVITVSANDRRTSVTVATSS